MVSPVENEGDLKPFRLPAIFSGGPLASLSVKAPSVGIQARTKGLLSVIYSAMTPQFLPKKQSAAVFLV